MEKKIILVDGKKGKCINFQSPIWIYTIYGILFTLFVFKMFFYANEINDVPDQWAQVSYVIYFEENPGKLIPEFENIKMYDEMDTFRSGNSIITEYKKGNDTCYLGHPPFYYKIMQMCGVVEVEGEYAYVNYTKLCYINILITSLTMIIILVTGFRKLLQRNAGWTVHFLFAVICTCLPLYGYVGSGVNNDNFCNLAMAVFWVGLLSYFEKGYCAKTYWLIAAGIIIAVCSKLTTGLVIVLVSVIFVLFDIVKRKKATIIGNRYLAVTVPLYLIILSYFIIIYARYGTFQPSYSGFAPVEEVQNSSFYVEESMRIELTFGEDVKHFFSGLLSTWMGTYNKWYTVSRTGILAVPFILVLILFLLHSGKGLYKFLRNKEMKIDIISSIFAISMIITILIQFRMHRKSYMISGYLGGYQARYYVPCLPVMAFGVCEFVDEFVGRYGNIAKRSVQIGAVIIGVLMIYADFFYYVLRYYGSYYGNY